MKIYNVAARQEFYEDLWLPIDTRLHLGSGLSISSSRGAALQIEIEFHWVGANLWKKNSADCKLGKAAQIMHALQKVFISWALTKLYGTLFSETKSDLFLKLWISSMSACPNAVSFGDIAIKTYIIWNTNSLKCSAFMATPAESVANRQIFGYYDPQFES